MYGPEAARGSGGGSGEQRTPGGVPRRAASGKRKPVGKSRTGEAGDRLAHTFRLLLLNLGFLLLAFVAAALAKPFALLGQIESSVYFPAGLAIGASCRCGWRVLPGIYAGIVLHGVLGYHLSPVAAALGALDTIGGCLVALWCLRRAGIASVLDNEPRRALFTFYGFGVLLGPLVSTLIGFLLSSLSGVPPGGEDLRARFFNFFLGNAFAVLLLAPAVYFFRFFQRDTWKRGGPGESSRGGFPRIARARRIEQWAWIAVASALLLVTAAFGDRIFYAGLLDVQFILYPMLAYAALRLGVPFTNIAVCVVCLTTLLFPGFGLGGTPRLTTMPELIRLGTFVLTLAVMAQAISVEAGERRTKQARITFDAFHDRQTGLGNVPALRNVLTNAMGTIGAIGRTSPVPGDAGDAPAPVIVVMGCVAFSHFKTLVQSFGFTARDAILLQFADFLRENLPPTVSLYRLADADFILLPSHVDADPSAGADALEIALADLTRQADTYRSVWEGLPIHVRLAASLVTYTGDPPTDPDATADALIMRTRELARGSRRHRYSLHRGREAFPTPNEWSRAHWLSELHEALQENRLELVGQPIVPLALTAPRRNAASEPEPIHFEVLIRLHARTGERLLPGLFLPVADDLGILPEIDRYVLAHLLAWLVEHPDCCARVGLCTVNVSASSLADPKFVTDAVDLIRESGVSPEKIGFELLENAALTQLDQARSFISAVRGMGCSVALDDFGTGVSSFAYLKTLPLDYVKIDGSFIRDLAPDSADWAIVEAVRRVSGQMGIRTVAEWVGTTEISEHLASLGVDYGQGVLFGEPVPLEALFHTPAHVEKTAFP